MMFSWIKYLFLLGTDVVGEVVEVGAGVTRFKVGDRVVSYAVRMGKEYNSSSKGAFQAYTVLLAHIASPIPHNLSYKSAAVLPLGLPTAACGLFQKDQLALQFPRCLVQSQPAKPC
jgi:NADPH:quinone reductase-like Zn-dependent oxidoreductase